MITSMQRRWRRGGGVPVEGHPAGLDPRDVHDELLVVVGAPPPPPPSSSSFSSAFFLLPPLLLLSFSSSGGAGASGGGGSAGAGSGGGAGAVCLCACVRCVWAGWAGGVKSPLCRVPLILHSANYFFNFFKFLAECHPA